MEKNIRPFQGKRWFRGNLHGHSHGSDGVFSPKHIAAQYKRANYDFIAISDHNQNGEFFALCDESFLVIPAATYSVLPAETEQMPENQGKQCRMVHFFGKPDSPSRLPGGTAAPVTKGSFVNRVQQTLDWGKNAGNLVLLAHPNKSGLFEETLLSVEGFTAVEIYNHRANLCDGTGHSEYHWDAYLRAGHKVWGIAADDGRQGVDYFGGWIMVSADALSAESIAAAIQAGSFYSSSGPQIEEYFAENGIVHIRCSPCREIRFIQYEDRGKMVSSADGENTLTEASFAFAPNAKFVRVECVTKEGGIAWSNPIFINEPGEKRSPEAFEHRLNPEKEVFPLTGQPIPTVGRTFFTDPAPLRHGPLRKGCLHAHTTRSDGKIEPAALCRYYQERGYAFLALTDHRIYTNTNAFDTADFLVLPGVELDVYCGSFDHDTDHATRQYTYHINGILADYQNENALPDGYVWERPLWSPAWETSTSLREKVQEAIDFLRGTGNMVMLNHPQWSGNLERDVLGFPGLFAMEIYNHGAESSGANGVSEHFYQYCLRNDMLLWQTATDDTHGLNSAFGGWVVVSAAEFTKASIADALCKGRFYSSTGPEIHDFWVENGSAFLSCGPARRVSFLTPQNMNGHVVHSAGVPVTKASCAVKPGEMVMAKVIGLDNTVAWTNPILVE